MTSGDRSSEVVIYLTFSRWQLWKEQMLVPTYDSERERESLLKRFLWKVNYALRWKDVIRNEWLVIYNLQLGAIFLDRMRTTYLLVIWNTRPNISFQKECFKENREIYNPLKLLNTFSISNRKCIQMNSLSNCLQ